MKRKFLILLLVAAAVMILLSASYAANENEQTNKTTLSMKANPPMKIGELVNQVKTHPGFKTYDSDALKWLEGLDSKDVVYSTEEGYIVMNSTDAAKIPDTVTTGVSVNCNITCKVLENRSLGNKLDDVLVVEDVEVASGELKNFDFGGN